MEYDDERECLFAETKHRVLVAVSEWRHRRYPTFELVPMIAGHS